MEFLNPFLLWAALAVVIPVIIHFWHQKKGQPIAWAATQWLGEKTQQQQRGLRLDNLLLLILRCLILLLLALLLSQPTIKGLEKSSTIQKIHLVQPDAFIVSNFRFELEEALKKREKVYWINPSPEPVTTIAQLPAQTTFTPLRLQTSIDQLARKDVDLHVYLLNDQSLAELPAIQVPANFQLHVTIDSSRRVAQDFLEFSTGKKLFVNASNRLSSGPTLPESVRFSSGPAYSGSLSVLLDFRNRAEQQTVNAALQALTEVYGLDVSVDVERRADKKYVWELTDREPAKPTPQTLYVVTGTLKPTTMANVFYIPDVLTPQTSDLVETGQLPEILGEILVRHFGLKSNPLPLSEQELNGLFKRNSMADQQQDDRSQKKLQNILGLFFVVLIGVERGLALTKNT
ncbi:MAG: BatA domain-containing protein [Cytophagaceae bacterium]|nr:BatA domain-containing protein [Cytophagaceae bacterium]